MTIMYICMSHSCKSMWNASLQQSRRGKLYMMHPLRLGQPHKAKKDPQHTHCTCTGLSLRAVTHNTCYSRQASLMSLWWCRWTCLFLVQFTHRVCYGCEDQGLKTFDRPVLELAVILSYCSPVVIFKGSHFWVGSYFWRDPYLLGSIGKYLTNVTFRELLLRWTIIFMVCRKTSWCHQ